MSIVVTAATGQLGRRVVASLLNRGVDSAAIIATGRSTERLAEVAGQGVRVAELDYSKPVDGVVNTGDTVLLISGSEVGQRTLSTRSGCMAASFAPASSAGDGPSRNQRFLKIAARPSKVAPRSSKGRSETRRFNNVLTTVF